MGQDEIIFLKLSEVQNTIIKNYLINLIEEQMSCVHEVYPDFKKWFYEKIFNGIKINDEREIIVGITDLETKNKVELSCLAILKNTNSEKKICTFLVFEKYWYKSFGSKLMEECFKHLGTNRPLITISEDKINMFRHLIKKYNFELTDILNDIYREGIKEYIFNGEKKLF